jgi:rod shape-determining protein MreC
VALGLVLLSLGLVTVYLRESSDGALHGAQRIGVSILTPFEVAGERIARPFQDAWGWTTDLFNAKDENAKLREQNRELRAAAIENQTARQENEHLRNQLNYIEGTEFPKDFKPVVTRVIVQPQTVYRQEIMVAAGSSNGIRVNDPVVTDEGLVGLVSEVTPRAAKVRLLTDDASAASAIARRPTHRSSSTACRRTSASRRTTPSSRPARSSASTRRSSRARSRSAR